MCLRTLLCLGLSAPWRAAKGHCPHKTQPWAASQNCMVPNLGAVEERPHGSLSLEWENGQRILGQLRNFGGSGQESCTFHSLDLLRLCQLQPVKHLTLESIGASFKEAFSPPGDAAEQKKKQRNSTCSQQQKPPAALLQPASTQAAMAAVGKQPPHVPLKQGGLGTASYNTH